MISESPIQVVIRFFDAIEVGDIETVRSIYSPDALIWHNDDLLEQPVEGTSKAVLLQLLPGTELQQVGTAVAMRCCRADLL